MPRADGKPNRRAVWDFYQDGIKEWRWRLVAANGRIIADSGEGYTTKGAAVIAAKVVSTHAARAVFP